jgi:hypothetical protein
MSTTLGHHEKTMQDGNPQWKIGQNTTAIKFNMPWKKQMNQFSFVGLTFLKPTV